jgi:hypothetical protein
MDVMDVIEEMDLDLLQDDSFGEIEMEEVEDWTDWEDDVAELEELVWGLPVDDLDLQTEC